MAKMKRKSQRGNRRHQQLRRASSWEPYEVLLTRDWDEAGELVQAVVSRRSPDGHLAVAVFLIDLACLGIKNALYDFMSVDDYEVLVDHIRSKQALVDADIDLVAKIVRAGEQYAAKFGFAPHPDYHQAKELLGDANPDAPDEEIPLGGPEGKPYFIAGPYDDVDKIMKKLTRAVGRDGFNYTIPMHPDDEMLVLEDDEFEW